MGENVSRQQTYESLKILTEAPLLIKLSKEIIQHLPKGKERDALIKNLLNVKRSLIDLDVCLQDIEWGILQKQMDKEEQYK